MTHQNPVSTFRRRRLAPKRTQGGFTLVEIMIVILILGVLMNIAMPSFIKVRDAGQARSCIANLKRIAGAREEYALENHLNATSSHPFVWADFQPYIHGPEPLCPTNKSHYLFQDFSQTVQCTYGAPQSDPINLQHIYNFQ